MNKEALIILMEECAEVQCEAAKCLRFGIDSDFLQNGKTALTRLNEEVGDLLAMVDILIEYGVIDPDIIEDQKQIKFNKLTAWSNLTFKNYSK
jgi:hypothetical protein